MKQLNEVLKNKTLLIKIGQTIKKKLFQNFIIRLNKKEKVINAKKNNFKMIMKDKFLKLIIF